MSLRHSQPWRRGPLVEKLMILKHSASFVLHEELGEKELLLISCSRLVTMNFVGELLGIWLGVFPDRLFCLFCLESLLIMLRFVWRIVVQLVACLPVKLLELFLSNESDVSVLKGFGFWKVSVNNWNTKAV